MMEQQEGDSLSTTVSKEACLAAARTDDGISEKSFSLEETNEESELSVKSQAVSQSSGGAKKKRKRRRNKKRKTEEPSQLSQAASNETLKDDTNPVVVTTYVCSSSELDKVRKLIENSAPEVPADAKEATESKDEIHYGNLTKDEIPRVVFLADNEDDEASSAYETSHNQTAEDPVEVLDETSTADTPQEGEVYYTPAEPEQSEALEGSSVFVTPVQERLSEETEGSMASEATTLTTLSTASEASKKSKKARRRRKKSNKKAIEKAQAEEETKSLEDTSGHSKDDTQEVLGNGEQKLETAESELESNNEVKVEDIISDEIKQAEDVTLSEVRATENENESSTEIVQQDVKEPSPVPPQVNEEVISEPFSKVEEAEDEISVPCNDFKKEGADEITVSCNELIKEAGEVHLIADGVCENILCPSNEPVKEAEECRECLQEKDDKADAHSLILQEAKSDVEGSEEHSADINEEVQEAHLLSEHDENKEGDQLKKEVQDRSLAPVEGEEPTQDIEPMEAMKGSSEPDRVEDVKESSERETTEDMKEPSEPEPLEDEKESVEPDQLEGVKESSEPVTAAAVDSEETSHTQSSEMTVLIAKSEEAAELNSEQLDSNENMEAKESIKQELALELAEAEQVEDLEELTDIKSASLFPTEETESTEEIKKPTSSSSIEASLHEERDAHEAESVVVNLLSNTALTESLEEIAAEDPEGASVKSEVSRASSRSSVKSLKLDDSNLKTAECSETDLATELIAKCIHEPTDDDETISEVSKSSEVSVVSKKTGSGVVKEESTADIEQDESISEVTNRLNNSDAMKIEDKPAAGEAHEDGDLSDAANYAAIDNLSPLDKDTLEVEKVDCKPDEENDNEPSVSINTESTELSCNSDRDQKDIFLQDGNTSNAKQVEEHDEAEQVQPKEEVQNQPDASEPEQKIPEIAEEPSDTVSVTQNKLASNAEAYEVDSVPTDSPKSDVSRDVNEQNTEEITGSQDSEGTKKSLAILEELEKCYMTTKDVTDDEETSIAEAPSPPEAQCADELENDELREVLDQDKTECIVSCQHTENLDVETTTKSEEAKEPVERTTSTETPESLKVEMPAGHLEAEMPAGTLGVDISAESAKSKDLDELGKSEAQVDSCAGGISDEESPKGNECSENAAEVEPMEASDLERTAQQVEQGNIQLPEELLKPLTTGEHETPEPTSEKSEALNISLVDLQDVEAETSETVKLTDLQNSNANESLPDQEIEKSESEVSDVSLLMAPPAYTKSAEETPELSPEAQELHNVLADTVALSVDESELECSSEPDPEEVQATLEAISPFQVPVPFEAANEIESQNIIEETEIQLQKPSMVDFEEFDRSETAAEDLLLTSARSDTSRKSEMFAESEPSCESVKMGEESQHSIIKSEHSFKSLPSTTSTTCANESLLFVDSNANIHAPTKLEEVQEPQDELLAAISMEIDSLVFPSEQISPKFSDLWSADLAEESLQSIKSNKSSTKSVSNESQSTKLQNKETKQLDIDETKQSEHDPPSVVSRKSTKSSKHSRRSSASRKSHHSSVKEPLKSEPNKSSRSQDSQSSEVDTEDEVEEIEESAPTYDQCAKFELEHIAAVTDALQNKSAHCLHASVVHFEPSESLESSSNQTKTPQEISNEFNSSVPLGMDGILEQEGSLKSKLRDEPEANVSHVSSRGSHQQNASSFEEKHQKLKPSVPSDENSAVIQDYHPSSDKTDSDKCSHLDVLDPSKLDSSLQESFLENQISLSDNDEHSVTSSHVSNKSRESASSISSKEKSCKDDLDSSQKSTAPSLKSQTQDEDDLSENRKDDETYTVSVNNNPEETEPIGIHAGTSEPFIVTAKEDDASADQSESNAEKTASTVNVIFKVGSATFEDPVPQSLLSASRQPSESCIEPTEHAAESAEKLDQNPSLGELWMMDGNELDAAMEKAKLRDAFELDTEVGTQSSVEPEAAVLNESSSVFKLPDVPNPSVANQANEKLTVDPPTLYPHTLTRLAVLKRNDPELVNFARNAVDSVLTLAQDRLDLLDEFGPIITKNRRRDNQNNNNLSKEEPQQQRRLVISSHKTAMADLSASSSALSIDSTIQLPRVPNPSIENSTLQLENLPEELNLDTLVSRFVDMGTVKQMRDASCDSGQKVDLEPLESKFDLARWSPVKPSDSRTLLNCLEKLPEVPSRSLVQDDDRDGYDEPASETASTISSEKLDAETEQKIQQVFSTPQASPINSSGQSAITKIPEPPSWVIDPKVIDDAVTESEMTEDGPSKTSFIQSIFNCFGRKSKGRPKKTSKVGTARGSPDKNVTSSKSRKLSLRRKK